MVSGGFGVALPYASAKREVFDDFSHVGRRRLSPRERAITS